MYTKPNTAITEPLCASKMKLKVYLKLVILLKSVLYKGATRYYYKEWIHKTMLLHYSYHCYYT